MPDIMTYARLLRNIETITVSTIREAYPRRWREDSTTDRLLQRFEDEIGAVQIKGVERSINVRWNAFKMTKKRNLEPRYGDIAVIVKHTSWEGRVLEGVGFMESKRRDETLGTYNAIKTPPEGQKSQLEKICENAPMAFLLLYDYAQMNEYRDNIQGYSRYDEEFEWYIERRLGIQAVTAGVPVTTHSLVVPIRTAIALDLKSTGLHTYGLPLSHQLGARYLRGFDLDYAPKLVDEIKKGAADIGLPDYLLQITIAPDTDPFPEGGDGIDSNNWDSLARHK